MSLLNYQNLQQATKQPNNKLGCKLPILTSGTLKCASTVQSAAQTREMIVAFKPQQGWFMLRDKLVVAGEPPSENEFIEGEWCHGLNSVKVKLLYDDQYQLTTMTVTQDTTGNQVYSEQPIYLRSNLKNAPGNLALYRLWWALPQGENLGRWQPLAQQFAGFHLDQRESK
jgi:hypothetical protein